MKTYKDKYKNYAEYIACQICGFEKKKKNIWAKEENIAAIARYIEDWEPKTGLCHGTRGGYEQLWFMKYLSDCIVRGTEIGETDAPHTIRRDFNLDYPDLTGKHDFIYSNSFDHAFDPEKTIKIWADQLKPGGLLIIEWDKRNEHTGEVGMLYNKLDCVSLTFAELQHYIPEWIGGKINSYVLDLPVVTNGFRKAIVFEVE